MQKARRQFSVEIIKCDGFISLPATAQALYLQLMMSCDDEGFTSSIELCKYMAHATDADEQALIKKRFIYQFESDDVKVTVIKHWWMNNWIRKDKIVKSAFSERSKVYIKANGNYTLDPTEGQTLDNLKAVIRQTGDSQEAVEGLSDGSQWSETSGKKKSKTKKEETQSNQIQSNVIQSNPTNPIQRNLTELNPSQSTTTDEDEELPI